MPQHSDTDIEGLFQPTKESQDAELIVAVFRTLVLLVALLIPNLLHNNGSLAIWEIALGSLAGIYNIAAGIACIFPHRFGLRRPFIVAMDALLVTAWIHLSEQWELFPFYYLVVVVAAMWFRVFGGAVTAVFCNFFYMLLWASAAADPTRNRVEIFTVSMALNAALLFLVGCLVGYIVEIQEQERQHRLEDELLIANYQREIDLSTQLQPLLMDREWFEDSADGGRPAVRSLTSPASRQAVAHRTLPGLEIGAAMRSARTLGGGDYFDLIPLDEERMGICIADVSGKSVRAQARLPLLKYALRALAPLYPEPQELVRRLNGTLLPDLQPELYIAMCYVLIDSSQHTIRWCNAGHIPPLLIPAEPEHENISKALLLDTDGPALGMFEGIEYTGRSLPWGSGDQLLLFTDGLTDAFSYDGSEDGEEQVRLLAASLAHQQSPKEVAQEFLAMATAITDGDDKQTPALSRLLPLRTAQRPESQHRDDITVILVKNTL